MGWTIRITDEAKKDYNKLEGSIRKQVLAGIIKVSKAPLPSPNGYGKPLGNKNGNNLTGFFKIKYRGIGIRVVYIALPRIEDHRRRAAAGDIHRASAIHVGLVRRAAG